jgi:uncharacterized Rmd1/YagE family protein
VGDTILSGHEEEAENIIYAKLAFSNGIARSTKPVVFEEQLENYLDSTRKFPVS